MRKEDMINQNTDLVQFFIGTLPIAVLGMIGWVAHNLASDEPINMRRFIAGACLAGFTGWVTAALLLSMNFPGPMAASLGAILGASGFEGFQWAVKLAKKQLPMTEERKK